MFYEKTSRIFQKTAYQLQSKDNAMPIKSTLNKTLQKKSSHKGRQALELNFIQPTMINVHNLE